MGRDVLEVRQPGIVPWDPIPVVFDGEIMRAMLLAARDGDDLGVRIDRVLDEFGDRLQGVALRECDDPDGVPVIPDAQLPAVFLSLCFHAGTTRALRASRALRLVGNMLRFRSAAR